MAHTDAANVAAKALTYADGAIETLKLLIDGDYYGGDEPLPLPIRRRANRAAKAAAELRALIADLYEEMP